MRTNVTWRMACLLSLVVLFPASSFAQTAAPASAPVGLPTSTPISPLLSPQTGTPSNTQARYQLVPAMDSYQATTDTYTYSAYIFDTIGYRFWSCEASYHGQSSASELPKGACEPLAVDSRSRWEPTFTKSVVANVRSQAIANAKESRMGIWNFNEGLAIVQFCVIGNNASHAKSLLCQTIPVNGL